jgi:Fungal specific transcription factor domain
MPNDNLGFQEPVAETPDCAQDLTYKSNQYEEEIVEWSSRRLPSQEDVLQLVNDYFVYFNSVIPLFHQSTFMRMLHEWYSGGARQDSASWAALNIVMAIAHRCCAYGRLGAGTGIESASSCLKNAQSVVSDLVTRDEDLLGLQVLLGMVILFQGTEDAKPASVLIGTAIRLAHRMQLHSQEAMKFFLPEVQVQRSRLFWIAYMLDKVGLPKTRVQ